jgi:hypothetical protein
MDAEMAAQDFCATRDRLALAERQLATLAARETVVRAFVICDGLRALRGRARVRSPGR